MPAKTLQAFTLKLQIIWVGFSNTRVCLCTSYAKFIGKLDYNRQIKIHLFYLFYRQSVFCVRWGRSPNLADITNWYLSNLSNCKFIFENTKRLFPDARVMLLLSSGKWNTLITISRLQAPYIYTAFFSLSKVTVFCLRMTHLFGSLLFTPNTHRNLFKMSYDGIEGCSTWRLPSKGQFLNEVARLHSHLLIPHNCIRLCTLYLPYLDSTN